MAASLTLAPPSDDECDRLLLQVTPALHGLLFAYSPLDARLATARPVLELRITAESSSSLSKEHVTAALSAFTALVRFSQRFDTLSLESETGRLRKKQFWLCVCGSSMMQRLWATKESWQEAVVAPLLRHNISPWMLEAPTFPKFAAAIKFQGHLDPEVELKLAAFAAKSAGNGDGKALTTPLATRGLQIGVSIEVNSLQTEPQSLQIFLAFLRRVCRHSDDRHFVLSGVQYSWGMPCLTQLALVNEVLRGNNSIYKVRTVMMTNLMPVSYGKRELKGIATMIDAAFGVQTTAAASPAGSARASPSRNALQKVSLDQSLRVQQYAAICSALRYGCAVEELELNLHLYSVPTKEKQQIWRWIAFGLFHPRSQRFASNSRFQLRKLAFQHPNLDLADAEAFRRALESPSELVLKGSGPSSAAPERVKICVVAAGAAIYKSPSTATASSVVIKTLMEEQELESIYARSDWLCVVIPCVGLGWVQSEHVVLILDDELNDVSPYRLSLEWVDKTTSPPGLAMIFRSIGATVGAVVFVDCKFTSEFCAAIKAIGASTRPKHLSIRESTFVKAVIETLLRGLRGDLGERLVSLNLCNNKTRNFPLLDAVTEIVADPSSLLLLEELRLDMRTLSHATLAHLDKAFAFNKTLAIVELQDRMPVEYRFDDAVLGVKRKRFDAAHQHKLLRVQSSLTMAQKAAFLSTVVSEDDPAGREHQRARRALDSEMISQIFRFAGREVRREIVWKYSPLGFLRGFGLNY